MSFGKVIFGDNQFLGINHADPEKAKLFQDRFKSADAIIEVIGWAYQAGVRDFMFTTHGRLDGAFREILRSRMFPEMNYVPCLPDTYKYANALAEGSFVSVIGKRLASSSKLGVLGGLGRAAIGDLSGLMQLLVEVELLMTRGLRVNGIFLHNVIFDLAMGLHATTILERFHRYVEDKLFAIPGYITLNHPQAQKVLCEDIGIKLPWLCSNFNVAGFRMNPSLHAVEASFANGLSRNIAMSIFASGSLNPQDSITYIKGAVGVDAMLFGSSRQANIFANVKHLGS